MTITINNTVKINNPKINGYSVLDNLAKAIYGKPIIDCLGSKQTISVKRTRGNNYVVNFPKLSCEVRHTALPCSVYEYTKNVVSHCKSNWISITINMV